MHLTETSLRVRTREDEVVTEPRTDPRLAVDRAFVDVLAGRPPAPGLVDVAQALATHRLAVAVAEATRTGSLVQVGGR